MIYIGIDPGLNGGIAIMKPEGIETLIMPTTTIKRAGKDKRVISHEGLKEIFKVFKSEECYAMVEEQQSMSKGGKPQGVISMVTLGVGFGALLQALTDFDIDFERVNPQDWQKEFGIANGDTKVQALEVCQSLFPNLNLLATKRSRKAHKGIVDAALILMYAKRRYERRLNTKKNG